MMKHFLITLSLLTLSFAGPLRAQSTFEADGINYKITKEADEANTFGTVTVIARDAAFYEGEVNIPNAVKNSGGQYADTYKVTAIDNGAFKDCIQLRNVKVPASVETIGENAFQNCKALETVTFATGNLKTMGRSVFQGSGLKSITLPEGLVDLPWICFTDCPNLENVKLPTTLKTIGSSAFSRCPMLRSITLPAGLQEIMMNAFGQSGLESIELPVKVVTIPDMCFAMCEKLKTVKLSPYTHTINDQAFAGCSSLSSINLPANVSVGETSFYGCTSLPTAK